MDFKDIQQALSEIPDEVLSHISVTMPWQSGVYRDQKKTDADGFDSSLPGEKDMDSMSHADLQKECWDKFNKNPQVSTATRGVAGRITGYGFEVTSDIWEIQEILDEVEFDPRNRLYHFWPKMVTRAFIEGELFQIFTCHNDGFIEVDFLDPALLSTKGDKGSGIIFHPDKKLFPLFYLLNGEDASGNSIEMQIPSINIARYPELIDVARKNPDFNTDYQESALGGKPVVGGYRRFVVAWERGFMTRRAISYLRTVIEWLNHYENLKKFEIDHKKSSGAYAWAVTFEDVKAFKLWINMTDEERAKTALMAPFEPGARLFLPPGCKIEPKNPNLPRISDSDTDILQMAISGLNEPADVTTGTASGTFASVKASRGPMSDRTSDEVADFDRFYRHDFYASIFFLKSKIAGFPEFFAVEEAVGFKNQEPVFKKIKRRPQFLIDVQYPISETIDLGARTGAVLGVKHGPLSETIGISQSNAAKMVGIGAYGRNRLRKATEDKKYPKLAYLDGLDPEAKQENALGEPKIKKKKVAGDDNKE
ncbi:MAG: hypothetical protein WA151_11355 [Desulfatirhabdiaceae bacterium]